MTIGQDLLAVPFPDMVYNLARAIADGQKRLDKNSLNTLKELSRTTFKFIESITEVLQPDPIDVDIDGTTITVTGVKVKTSFADPTPLTLLQAGLTPTFYQFTEALIEVKISLKSTTDTEVKVDSGFEFDQTVGLELGFGGGILGGLFGGPSGKITSTTHVATHTDISVSNKYSYSAEGSSVLRTTLKPVPPPQRVMPRFITVNALLTPPQVTIGQ